MPKAKPRKKTTSSKKATQSKKATTAEKSGSAVRSFTAPQLKKMKARIQADPVLRSATGFFNTFIQASEYIVIQMMQKAGVWSGPATNPGGKGAVEFGLLDYWMNNPGNDPILKGLRDIWKAMIGLPVTQINAANYQSLLNAVAVGKPGLVAPDGTWYSQSTYGQMDPNWNLAVLMYIYHYFGNDFATFAQTPKIVPITGASPNQVKIALVGDWGTGPYPNGPAASVMQAIVKQNPDYIIHLGDVYYAGTSSEEQNNLLSVWPAAYSGKSFTLNSNHEMYDGAFGYFKALTNNIFKLQNQTSYFALQYANPQQPSKPWTILGLDSAFWSPSPMVMDGSIQGIPAAGPGYLAQPTFIQGLVKGGLAAQNAIVLTHHNPIAYDGSELVTDWLGNCLWAQVTAALSGTPKAWYWGHVHNGIVYPNPTYTKNNVYGRCVGHGALPFGNAWGLQQVPASQVQCYDNTANPSLPPRVMNGFAMLTITTGGQATEAFFQQDGTPAPWVKGPLGYQLG
jgi:hypothetical protein